MPVTNRLQDSILPHNESEVINGNHDHRNSERHTRKTKGGAFLLETRAREEIFTPEDFTVRHHAIAKTTEQFFNNEVAPHVDEINHQNHALAAQILKKSVETSGD